MEGNKILKKLICFFIILIIIFSSNINAMINEEVESDDIELNFKLYTYNFMIGSIFNLSYFEYDYDNITGIGYDFQCSFLLSIEINNLGLPLFNISRNGEARSLFETLIEEDDVKIEMYYKCYISENFICVLQVLKTEF